MEFLLKESEEVLREGRAVLGKVVLAIVYPQFWDVIGNKAVVTQGGSHDVIL
jgi:hypothetical protein